jgi:hypothetical protein
MAGPPRARFQVSGTATARTRHQSVTRSLQDIELIRTDDQGTFLWTREFRGLDCLLDGGHPDVAPLLLVHRFNVSRAGTIPCAQNSGRRGPLMDSRCEWLLEYPALESRCEAQPPNGR